MKTFLLVAGTVFALFAATIFFIMYEHWGESHADLWFVLIHAALGIGCASLAVWAFRLSRHAAPTAA